VEIDQEILSLNPDGLEIDPKTKMLMKQLLNVLEQFAKENAELREEVQRLRDENARLKGGKGKPRILPNVKGTDVKDDRDEAQKKAWDKGLKLAHVRINRTETISVDKRKVPKDAVFKGYRRVTVQEIKFESDNVQFLIERYYSKSENRIYEGELPAWVGGGFGPKLKAFVMNMYFAGRVTENKIRTILTEMGIIISEGEISGIITKTEQERFTEEKDGIFKAGMEAAEYVQSDDTALRHKGVNHHVMIVCNPHFGAFFINRYKNGETVRRVFGLKGGKYLDKVLITDNARQFWDISKEAALCWVHDHRHYKELTPWLLCNRKKLEDFKSERRAFFLLLKKYKLRPTIRKRERISKRFDELFTTRTGYEELDNRIAATYAEREKLLRVLDHPGIPLDNNESERGLREIVVKRLVSHGTRSEAGRMAWENMMTILDTCRKNGVSFYYYVRDILSNEYSMPRLSELVLTNSKLATTSY
jgi:hypothetical protein